MTGLGWIGIMRLSYRLWKVKETLKFSTREWIEQRA